VGHVFRSPALSDRLVFVPALFGKTAFEFPAHCCGVISAVHIRPVTRVGRTQFLALVTLGALNSRLQYHFAI
jgi:hypothetical protein